MRIPSLAAAIALATTGAFALDQAQIESVFPGQTNLTGDTKKLRAFQFTVITNATHALISLNSTKIPSQVGWLSIGQGSGMDNADYLVAWPNTASNSNPWTLSHRRPNGNNVMPVVASTASGQITSAFYTLVPELSTTASSPFTAVSFMRLLQPPSDYPASSSLQTAGGVLTQSSTRFIYAACSSNPGSTDESASIEQHDQGQGTTTLNLSTPVVLASTGGTTTGGTGTGASDGSTSNSDSVGVGASASGMTYRDKILIAHAVTGSLALIIFAPIAILIGRYMRRSKWFPVHAGIMVVVAALVIACFGMGVWATDSPAFDDSHQRVGLAVFIVVIVQVALGAVAHKTRAGKPSPSTRIPTLVSKSPFRLLHIPIGILIVAAGFYQVNSGFDEWESSSDAGSEVPTAVTVVFWIVLAVVVVAYVAGWVLEILGRINRPRQGSLDEKEMAHLQHHANDSAQN